MPAYNFKPQFAQLVRAGTKHQTIRPRRKRPTQPGDTLYLFTGQRTQHCQLLRKTICVSTQPIDIYPTHIELDAKILSVQQTRDLAERDGFTTLDHFYDFFHKTYGLPLIGKMELIKWPQKEEAHGRTQD